MAHVLGIASNGTDSAACLVNEQGLICAVEEERFTGQRHEGRFPQHAIQWCLEFSGVEASDLVEAAIAWDYGRYSADSSGRPRIVEFYQSLEEEGYAIDWPAVQKHQRKFCSAQILGEFRSLFPHLSGVPVSFYRHHDCHAASSFCFSGLESALTLIMDEKGEESCVSLYSGQGTRMEKLSVLNVPHSLGLFYAAATQFFRFVPFRDEGTLMALATTGTDHEDLRAWLERNVLRKTPDGFALNPEYVSKDVFRYERGAGQFFTSRMFSELRRFGIDRPRVVGVFEPCHGQFAYVVQRVLEDVVLSLLLRAVQKYREPRVCLAGGVGLNCSLNGRIAHSLRRECEEYEVFVPPWCHDAGGAIGAAVLGLAKSPTSEGVMTTLQYGRLTRADWGPEYGAAAIKRTLDKASLLYSESAHVAQTVAQHLARGRIVAWYDGRAEFGPRALGQRSLLCHPAKPECRRTLQRIKERFEFRPFAPSILEEHAHKYFESGSVNTDFMTVAFRCTDAARRDIPNAISTSDGTLRAQTVGNRPMWLYRELLEEFYKLTGIPALVNTSFNIKEPLVLTPDRAVSTFLRSDADVLAMGAFLVPHPSKTWLAGECTDRTGGDL